jgi:transposase
MIVRAAQPRARKPRSRLERWHARWGPACKSREELERLREQVEQDNQRIAELKRQIEQQRKKMGEYEKKIVDLERQLALRRRNSTNSSKPPSSDGLAGPERPRGCRPGRGSKRRKAGGQKGHPGHWRCQVPLERVNRVVVVSPDQCGHCQQILPADAGTRVSAGEPRRHQVSELPAIEAHITEYQMPSVVCPGCGKTTPAPLPAEVQGQFGPRLTAAIAYMTVICHIPRRAMQCLLEQVLGIPLSLGSTQNAWEEASAAVAEPYRELEQALPRQPVFNCDETSSRTRKDRRWLWVFLAQSFAFYTIEISRGTEVLVRLLGKDFAGILGNDRLGSYLKYLKQNARVCMQFCWAHFQRNLLGAQEVCRSAAGQQFCHQALSCERRLFRLWHRFRNGVSVRGSPPLSREQLIRKSIPIQKQLFALGERYMDSKDPDAGNLARALFEHNENFFLFLYREGVEPTNNVSERALRPAVQWRKITFGNRSREGELAVARLLTVRGTCQMRQRNALLYLTEAIQCYRAQKPAPSLLN